MKRFFDVFFSMIGIIVIMPFSIVLAILIKIESKGPVFYKQQRVGKNFHLFYLYKFRSMYLGSDKFSRLTVGERDPRITKIGFFMRKFKLDELPQLYNVLKGDMSLVGPRPLVKEQAMIYKHEQMEVFTVRPGITDYASIKYCNESEILSKVKCPDDYYNNIIMPDKINMQLEYAKNHTLCGDVYIIYKTIVQIFKILFYAKNFSDVDNDHNTYNIKNTRSYNRHN